MTVTSPKNRIFLVDAIRGFALLGLFLVHCLEHFDLAVYPETTTPFLAALDPILYKIIFFLFAGKAYAIFAFMFGLSFFIQTDKKESSTTSLHLRFIVRLLILAAFGYLHGLVYCGDVLIVLALLGLLLPFLNYLNNRILLWMALLLTLQPVILYHLLCSLIDPSYQLPSSDLGPLYGQAIALYKEHSFIDVIQFNSWLGQKMKWLFYIDFGRVTQILALFMLGLVAGRSTIFYQVQQHLKGIQRVFIIALLLFIPLYTLQFYTDLLTTAPVASSQVNLLLYSYANIAFTAVLITGFVLIYQRKGDGSILRVFEPMGRMSLTGYLTQSLIGVGVFYGFGLGLYRSFGLSYSLVYGLVFFTLQVLVYRWWFTRFYYGPVEWLWRSLTLGSFKTHFKR